MQGKQRQSDFRGSEYCFTNQYLWGNIYNMRVGLVEDFLCTIYEKEGNVAVHDFPVGDGDVKSVIEALLEDDKNSGRKTQFRGILEEQKKVLEELFPDKFEFDTNMDEWDYLYPMEVLSKLSGRKYHGKRNHISRFKGQNNWEYEAMTRDNVSLCQTMYQEWLTLYADRLDDSIANEVVMLEGCFNQFETLGLEGGLLKVDDKVVAFTIGEPLNSDTYIVHIEKAFSEIQGAYPMINQQFVQHNMQQFEYVNREEDMGIEGLRKAKMSYLPNPHLQKYSAKVK